MNTRGAGLVAVGVALAALVSACGGSALASDITPTAPAIVVEAVALDEVAAIEALGYPVGLVTWDFQEGFVNPNGGTAWASGDSDGFTTVLISTDADSYRQFSEDIEAAVRSTVRHEFGHALTYWLYPGGAEAPLSTVCTDVTESSQATGTPASECAAEAVSQLLTEQLGAKRIPFYGLAISESAIAAVRPTVDGALTWEVPAS